MRFGFVSDIHGRLPALSEALEAMEGVDEVICLGDVSGGRQSEECLQVLRQRGIRGVPGNHDLWDFELVGLSSESVAYLQARALELREADFLAVHSLHDDSPPRFSYIYSEADARELWKRYKEILVFFGHTHLPQLHWLEPGGEVGFAKARSGLEVEAGRVYEFSLREGYRYGVNVGTIEDGFVVYDSRARTIRYQFPRPLSPPPSSSIPRPKPAVSWWRKLF